MEASYEIFIKIWDVKRDKFLIELVTDYKHDWKKIARRVRRVLGISTSPNVLKDYY